MVEEYRREQFWREYTANHIWLIAGALCGITGQELPSKIFSDMIRPKQAEKPQTAAEIIHGVRDKLRA